MARYPRLEAALRIAMDAHAGQEKDGEDPLPYIFHPAEVVANLRYVGGITDEDLLCAAALHDVLEHSPVEAAAVGSAFGSRVRALVEELTRREPTAAEVAGMTPDQVWRLRADMLLSEIGRMGPEASVVKLADRLANVREAKRSKKGKKLERYLWQTERILEIVPKRRNRGLWEAIRAELRNS